jgi:hypothetical protein
MRTKTLALSTVLTMLAGASAMAQTPVYSLNAVGYINATIQPGYQIMTCPLICSPDNSIGTLFPNGGGGTPTSNQWTGLSIYNWNTNLQTYDTQDLASAKLANKSGYTNGWTSGGTNTLYPGQAMWISWSGGSPTNVTFVGTVPQNGSPYMTNSIPAGAALIGSAIPMNGDLVTNTNTTMTGFEAPGDGVYLFEAVGQTYDTEDTYSGTKHGWNLGGSPDPTPTNGLTQGFWYFNTSGATETWVENFSVNP